jgi:hypothetical protein
LSQTFFQACTNGIAIKKQTCFEICKQNDWDYIFTFKDECLKSVQDEVTQLRPLAEQQNNKQKNTLCEDKKVKKEIFEFINQIEYQLNWVEYNKMYDAEVEQRFTHITNITITKKNGHNISYNG